MRKLVPGDLIRFFAHHHLCLVLEIRVERYEGTYSVEGGEEERIIRYLHPLLGVMERSLVEFNGKLYVGMKEVVVMNERG